MKWLEYEPLNSNIYGPLMYVIAGASGYIVCLLIAMHTGSIWLLCIGLLQITLALPLSYAIHHFVFGISFFLN